MLVAVDSNKKRIYADDAIKDNGPFSCPVCANNLILKKGKQVVHHFSHRPNSLCSFGAGETETHRLCKKFLYEQIKSTNPVSLELEYRIGEAEYLVADVFAMYREDCKIAIEIQHSKRSSDYLKSKTEYYSKMGIYTLWVIPINTESSVLWNDKHGISSWEKWLHQFYYGRVYYLDYKTSWNPYYIIPIHYGDYILYKEGGYNNEGEEFAGYSYYSKRYRTPNIGPSISLTDGSFKRHNKGKTNKWNPIDGALILKDTLPSWWQQKGTTI